MLMMIRRDGAPSHDLLTLLRVAAVADKGDAATALKAADAARRAVQAAMAESEAAGGADDEEVELPPLALGRLSLPNELTAQRALVGVLQRAVAGTEQGEAGAAAVAAAAALPEGSAVRAYRQGQRAILLAALDKAAAEVAALEAETAAAAAAALR
jgi:hypothetical protein